MTDTATAAGRRARSRKGEGRRLRDEILDATERLLIETGSSEAVSIRAVADAVGVTPPSIYRHFPDKVTLVYEVGDRVCAGLEEAFVEAVVGIDDPVERFVALGKAYVDFGRRTPEAYRLVFMSRHDETPAAYQEQPIRGLIAFRWAADAAQAAIDAGVLRPELTDATHVATMAWASAHGLTSLLVSKPVFPWPDLDRFIDEYVRNFVRGLLRDPG
ncbi:MAG TPA: TetR/AcrR family transcriptional regulator [Acidimicrobiales bacterium]|nr:TetR/AcrR family transcriptional regulator [Acidimicrobiales bacterium]